MVSKAPEPPSEPQARGVLVIGAVTIIGLAAALRLWNVGAGLPHNVSHDEALVMTSVIRMMGSGDFNPHMFDWPSLTFYLNLVVVCAAFLAGAMQGAWSSIDQVGRPELFLASRQFTALLGTATVFVLFSAARRWGPGVALIGAAMLAVNPLHVRESHFVLTDVPTAFFTSLTFLLSLRAHEVPTTRRLLAAAFAAGLAASCKYNGSMAIIMPLIAACANVGGVTALTRRISAVIATAAAGFLAGTPYAVLDLPKFLNDYARLAFAFAQERSGEPGWSLYVKHIVGAIGWPAAALTASGFLMSVVGAIAGPIRVRALMAAGFAVVYFAVMARSYSIYGRYLLPLVPFLGLFCAIAIVQIVGWLKGVSERTRTLLIAGLAIVALATPTVGAVRFSRQLGWQSTIDLLNQWVLGNVPPGATIAIEAGAIQLPGQYHSVFVRSLPDRSYESYKDQGVDYLVAAAGAFQATLTDPKNNREAFVAYRELLGSAELVAGFDASPSTQGPSLRVYRIPR